MLDAERWGTHRKLAIACTGLASLLLLITAYSTTMISRASSNNIQKSQHQHNIQQSLYRYSSDLKRLESSVFLYAMLMQKPQEDNLNKAINSLGLKTLSFINMESVQQYEDIAQQGKQLFDFTSDLKKHVSRLAVVLHDPHKNFPATPIISNILLPLNNDFINYTNIGIESSQAIKNVKLRGKILKLWNTLRYLWTQQTGQVRLFFSNRSGTFGLPEVSMQTNLQNREIYKNQITKILDELSKENLGIEQSDALKHLKETFTTYENVLDNVIFILEGDHWRNDIQIINNDIRPTLEDIWHVIENINTRLKSLSANEFYDILNTSNKVSYVMIFFSIFVIALIAFLYRYFETNVRRPIIQIAEAMESESDGSFPKKILSNNTETQIFCNAFNKMQKNIHDRQLRLQSILDNVSDGIITLNESGKIESFNSSCEILFGFHCNEVLGYGIDYLLNIIEDETGNKHINTEEILKLLNSEYTLLAKQKSKGLIPVRFKMSKMVVQGQTLYTAIVSDISQTRAMIERLRSIAEHDQLTGLYNRFYFIREIEDILVKKENSNILGFIFVNLDHFKFINDTLGHHVGDAVLRQISQILQNLINNDMLARIGADEFGILIHNARKEYCISLAQRIKELISKIQYGETIDKVDISCSIGIVLDSGHSSTGTELFAKGDVACQLAKTEREKIHTYIEQDKKNIDTMSIDMSIAKQIKDALNNNRFVLAFQPIVDLQTLEVCNYEILLRMLGIDDNIIYPPDFIDVAEKYGLMLDIDKWVINKAAQYIKKVHSEDQNIKFSINLSTQSIMDPFTFETILRAVDENRVQANTLTFEVTETVAIENIELANTLLEKLQSLGCSTSLDDFGTGYSSFAYLRDLAVDFVKIDGSFVQDIHTNRVNRTMVKSLNEVAHAMKKISVAEYVKDQNTLDALLEIGVDHGQGFHFGKPEIVDLNIDKIETKSA